MKRTLATAVATTAIGFSLHLAASQSAEADPPPPARGIGGPLLPGGVPRVNGSEPPQYRREQPAPPAFGVGGGPLPDGSSRFNGIDPPHYHRSRIRHSSDWTYPNGWGWDIVIPRRIVVDHSPTYVVPADPPANFLPTPSADETGVMLINPKQNAGPVTYILNAIRFTMQPGYEQKLPAGQSWVLEFDRGRSFGTARYRLSAGMYAFAVTEHGWDVYRQTDPLPSDLSSPAAPTVAQATQ